MHARTACNNSSLCMNAESEVLMSACFKQEAYKIAVGGICMLRTTRGLCPAYCLLLQLMYVHRRACVLPEGLHTFRLYIVTEQCRMNLIKKWVSDVCHPTKRQLCTSHCPNPIPQPILQQLALS